MITRIVVALALLWSLPTSAQIFTSPTVKAISNRFQIVGSVTSERTGWVRGEGRIQFKTGPCAANNVAAVVAGFNRNIGSNNLVQDIPNENIITAELVLEFNSTDYRFTWSGQNTYNIAPGFEVYQSDPIPGLTIPASSTGFLRYNVTGTSWPEGAISNGFSPPPLAQYFISNAATSQVLGTGAMSQPPGGQGPGFSWSPAAVVGSYPCRPVYAIIGDSIVDWQNDGTGDGNGNIAYLRRAFWQVNGQPPSIKLSRGNDSFSQWNASNAGSIKMYRYATVVISEHAHNDIGGNTLASLLALARTTWAQITSFGLPIYQAKLLPQTNAANTLIVGSQYMPGGLRDQWNTALDAEVGVNITATIDPNTGCESQVNHGFWGQDTYASTDGIHPNSPGAAACATAIIPKLNSLLP